MARELHDLFATPGIKIYQDKEHLSFSIDSILLADFVLIQPRMKNIIDFGTGFGPIPLFLSTRTKAHLYGIDINNEAIELAKESVSLNHLEHQIELSVMDVKESYKYFASSMMDTVVCNPPFFRVTDQKVQNQVKAKTDARHETSLTLEEMIVSAKRLLTSGGSLTFIHRTDRLEEIILLLNKHRFHIKRMQYVYPKPGRKAMMVLIDARSNSSTGSLELLEPLYIMDSEGRYTNAVYPSFYEEV